LGPISSQRLHRIYPTISPPVFRFYDANFVKKVIYINAFSILAPLKEQSGVSRKLLRRKNQMNVNRELKNSVFTALFNNENKARELYAALKGIDYDPTLPIVITTLRDVLYMDRINDLSFTAEEKMALIIEHQSSLNHNMPLRILLYMSRVYEKIVDRKSLYRDCLVKIPRPEFIVLYNGTKKTPDQWEEQLSDAYMEVEANLKILLT
jgi:hypothetical protein